MNMGRSLENLLRNTSHSALGHKTSQPL